MDELARLRTVDTLKKAGVPFFEGLENAKMNMLAASCNLLKLPLGTDIIKEGDTGECFYVIIFGKVKVSLLERDSEGKVLPNAAKKQVGELSSGKYFGELALISDEPRLATLTVDSEYCVLLEFGRSSFRKIFLDTAESVADFAIRLQKEKVGFSYVLMHPFGIQKFTSYLESEYCMESIHFWSQAHEFNLMTRTEDRRIKGNVIYSTFIAQKSPEQVNIPATMRVAIEKRMEVGDYKHDLFEQARLEIFKLMERNNFKRFKDSKQFQELLEKLQPYGSSVVARTTSSARLVGDARSHITSTGDWQPSSSSIDEIGEPVEEH